jgi:hypothetical protein
MSVDILKQELQATRANLDDVSGNRSHLNGLMTWHHQQQMVHASACGALTKALAYHADVMDALKMRIGTLTGMIAARAALDSDTPDAVPPQTQPDPVKPVLQ